MQGASPADVKAQLVSSATPNVIQDDPALADSLNGSVSYEINISSTPNRLLYSMLNDQVSLITSFAGPLTCCCISLLCMSIQQVDTNLVLAVQCNQRLGMLLSPCVSSTHDTQSYGSAFTDWLVYRFDTVSNTRCGQTGLYSVGDSVSRDLKPRLCSC